MPFLFYFPQDSLKSCDDGSECVDGQLITDYNSSDDSFTDHGLDQLITKDDRFNLPTVKEESSNRIMRNEYSPDSDLISGTIPIVDMVSVSEEHPIAAVSKQSSMRLANQQSLEKESTTELTVVDGQVLSTLTPPPTTLTPPPTTLTPPPTLDRPANKPGRASGNSLGDKLTQLKADLVSICRISDSQFVHKSITLLKEISSFDIEICICSSK